ncbi:MAG: hypothetical protein ACOYOB_10180 [Myxococcota bacterium]
MRKPSNRRWPLMAAAACSVALLTVACGGPQRPLTEWLNDEESTPYAYQCTRAMAMHQSDLSSGGYNPASLFVHAWPEVSRTGPFLAESRLVAALEAGEVRRVLVLARGGLGKSRLAQAIHAQSCSTLPVFTVDLKDVAGSTAPEGRNTIVDTIARELGILGRVQAVAELEDRLARQHFLILLDSLEEVPLLDRPVVMGQVADLMARYPDASVVLLARPPVLDDDYGFPAEARLEIPPLECKVTDVFIARAHQEDETRRNFKAFLQHFGLDEAGSFGLQCTYPYLATYRDIQTMAEFEGRAASGQGNVTSSRATVYEYLLGSRLRKEFEQLSWTLDEALDMVDRLVRVQTLQVGQVELVFDLEGCMKAIDAKWGERSVDAGVGGNDEQRRRQICEKTFQSALFSRAEGVRAWVFADRGTRDLFLARWLNGEVARAADGDCSAISKHSELLAAPGIARFFVGQPQGQRCLAQVVSTLCTRDAEPSKHINLLDEGLPVGQGRTQPVKDALAAASSLEPKACVQGVLDALAKTLVQ